MKNLEVEADKANAYLEKTLLPKGTQDDLDCETKTPASTPEKLAIKSTEDNELQDKEAESQDEETIDDKVEAEPKEVEDKKDK